MYFIADLGALLGSKKGEMQKHLKSIKELIGED